MLEIGMIKLSLLLSLLFTSFFSFASKEVTLTEVTRFGSNPGQLKMFYYAPKKLNPQAPLVVVLHGCTQSAGEFDDETGWAGIADKTGSLLLLPQQTESNNQSRCFNWFIPSQTSRGLGEAHSIAEMVQEMKRLFSINEDRVSIVGLSAGAAMTSVMLASYPELFSSGALVAGIPFGCASNAFNAWSCMYAQEFPPVSARMRANYVRQASDFKEEYPRVLVLQGSADTLVSPRNGIYNLEQWVHVHGLQNINPHRTLDPQSERFDYVKKRKKIVSLIKLKNMPHGYPISTQKSCGKPSKYIIDVDYCASRVIADFFNL